MLIESYEYKQPKIQLMWKPLSTGQEVLVGNVVRYSHVELHANKIPEAMLYEVVKTEQHYFEVIPKAAEDKPVVHQQLAKKIIKYIDIGYYINLLVWDAAIQPG